MQQGVDATKQKTKMAIVKHKVADVKSYSFPFFEKVGSYPLPYASTSLRFAKLPTDTRGVLADRFAIASRACSDPASVVSSNCIHLVFHFLKKSVRTCCPTLLLHFVSRSYPQILEGSSPIASQSPPGPARTPPVLYPVIVSI